MRRLRLSMEEPRLEIMPLIDVIFLLLTFFVFALVLMVRADVLDIRMPTLGAGDPAQATAVVTIAIDAEGGVRVNGEPATLGTLVDRVRRQRELLTDASGAAPSLFVAADEGGRSGDLLRVLDILAGAGLGDVGIMGRPGSTGEE